MMKRILLLFCILVLAQSCKGRCRKRCQEGWTASDRILGKWCIKVIGLSSGTVTQAEAQAICAEENAVLSSLESDAEQNIVFWLLFLPNYYQVGFLGSAVSPNCSCPFSSTVFRCAFTEECNQETAFVWTDNFTVGTDLLVYQNMYRDYDTYYRQFLTLIGESVYYDGTWWSTYFFGWTDGEPGNGDVKAAAVCGRKAE